MLQKIKGIRCLTTFSFTCRRTDLELINLLDDLPEGWSIPGILRHAPFGEVPVPVWCSRRKHQLLSVNDLLMDVLRTVEVPVGKLACTYFPEHYAVAASTNRTDEQIATACLSFAK